VTPVLDVLGIGFGPSNLALAVAIEEHNALGDQRPLGARFLERQVRFGWHRGMLLDDATMQVSFLKDLVTLRNPGSDYSFVAYLHERRRLVDFVNHKILFPSRIEFHDYLEWAAARLAPVVEYDQRVTDVRPVREGHRVVAFDVEATDAAGGRRVRRSRSVVVAAGLAPRLPTGTTLGPRVWHNLDLLGRAALVPADPAPRRFVVVGAGQSAAEAVEYLHRVFPTAEVCSVFARFGYSSSDDTPYANRIFDPGAVDTYYGAGEDVKRMLFDYHRNTNYSVVDPDLIAELYRREYDEKVRGRRRLRMMNASQVTTVQEFDDSVAVEVEFLPTGEREILRADAVVYATGYEPSDSLALLGEAGGLVARRPDGAPHIGRDYRLVLTEPSDAALYLQGGTEHSHGIASTLLSNIAVRSGEIVASVRAQVDRLGDRRRRDDDAVVVAG
jgi:L-ornithine N5-monooxygenase